MSINGDFLNDDQLVEILTSAQTERELQQGGLRMRWMRKPCGSQVVLVECSVTGSFALLSQ